MINRFASQVKSIGRRPAERDDLYGGKINGYSNRRNQASYLQDGEAKTVRKPQTIGQGRLHSTVLPALNDLRSHLQGRKDKTSKKLKGKVYGV